MGGSDTHPPGSYDVDVYIIGHCCECGQVGPVRCQDRSAGFGTGDDEGVDRRSLIGLGPKPSSSAGKPQVEVGSDIARLEQTVRRCVLAGIALEALDEHSTGDDRWPEPLVTYCSMECCGSLRALGQCGYSTGIEDEGHSAGRLIGPAGEPTRKFAGSSGLVGVRGANLGEQLIEVLVTRSHELSAPQLDTHGFLEKL